MKYLARAVIACCVAAGTMQGAHAQDAGFLASFAGNWAGNGSVKLTSASPAVTVSCTFASNSTPKTLTFSGNCRGLIIVSRAIRADIKSRGAGYTGTYIGSRTGPAGLNGRRSGNAIALAIHWAKSVNGDRTAQLLLRKTGDSGMQLVVTDRNPKTGKNEVTTQINLRRA